MALSAHWKRLCNFANVKKSPHISVKGMAFPPPGALSEILYDASAIADRVAALGKQISADYAHIDTPLVIVGILKGSFVFLADLVRTITIDNIIEFMGVSSYGDKTISSGNGGAVLMRKADEPSPR
jgi:hypoxanthine phosphoribosyltransferase